jgi:hypothetical protein
MHQYVFIEGQNVNDPLLHVVENDSIQIKYDFSGHDIPVHIKITNKSEKPLYIDWKKSVAVIDGKKYNYWVDRSELNISGVTFPIYNSAISYADGEVWKDERISYIPPKSYIETTRIFLQSHFFNNLDKQEAQRFKLITVNGPVHSKRFNFSSADSPLTFRSLITVSSKESFSEETIYENSFYVSEIIESSHKHRFSDNKYLDIPFRHMDNSSVLSKRTAFGKTAGTITILGISTGLVYLSTLGSE